MRVFHTDPKELARLKGVLSRNATTRSDPQRQLRGGLSSRNGFVNSLVFGLLHSITLLWEERPMKRLFVTALLAAAATLLAGNLARANIVVGGYYHLGESDPGAAAGLPGDASSLDSCGNGNNLTYWQGHQTYSSSVAASAAAATGSDLSMSFAGDGFYLHTGNALTVNTDNFGIEGWFKVNDLSQQGLAFNGDSFHNGFGLYVLGGHVQGLYGAVEAFDTGFAPTPGQWFYAALVRNGGDTEMFVNNTTPIDFGSTYAPITPGAQFSLGIAGNDELKGCADEVRVFAFGSQFGYNFHANSDLLIAHSVPEPSTLTLLTVTLLGLAAYAWRKRK
jgi:Concanavalin A-like lectin/glucanases superfamily/PEP-CTERM motif